MKPKAFFVITRYKEDISWIEEYTDQYLVYNKGEPIFNNYKILNNIPNFGNDVGSIPKFIADYYDQLPKYIAFLQGHPFDHCSKEKFNKIIYNECYTPITNFDGEGFLEQQIEHNGYGIYESYYNIMNIGFSNFIKGQDNISISFPPGSQMIVERSNVLKYSKKFWQNMNCLLNSFDPKRSELHGFERCMPAIVNAIYEEKR